MGHHVVIHVFWCHIWIGQAGGSAAASSAMRTMQGVGFLSPNVTHGLHESASASWKCAQCIVWIRRMNKKIKLYFDSASQLPFGSGPLFVMFVVTLTSCVGCKDRSIMLFCCPGWFFHIFSAVFDTSHSTKISLRALVPFFSPSLEIAKPKRKNRNWEKTMQKMEETGNNM